MEKKAYTAPQLVEYGDIEEITLNSNVQNCDVPCGANDPNSAIPPTS